MDRSCFHPNLCSSNAFAFLVARIESAGLPSGKNCVPESENALLAFTTVAHSGQRGSRIPPSLGLFLGFQFQCRERNSQYSLSLLYQELPNALPPMSVVHIQASYHIGSLSTKWQASFQIEASFALLPNRIDSSSDMLASSRSSDRDLV